MKHRVYGSALGRLAAGVPSDFINSIRSLKQRDRVVLYVRVSGPNQNPRRQIVRLRKAIRRLKLVEVACFIFYCPGHEERQTDLPYWATCTWVDSLIEVTACALQRRAIILAAEADRFARSRFIDGRENWNEAPSRREFQVLKTMTADVPLVSLLHPDTPAMEVRRVQSRSGQLCYGGNKGGRKPKPSQRYKLRQRKRLKPNAVRLRRDGFSYGQISKELCVPRSTIQSWVQGVEFVLP